MAKKPNKPTNKNVELGALKVRVDRIAERDPVHKSAAAIVRASVEKFVEAWDARHPENPSTK